MPATVSRTCAGVALVNVTTSVALPSGAAETSAYGWPDPIVARPLTRGASGGGGAELGAA